MADISKQIKLEEEGLGNMVSSLATDYVKSKIRESTLILRGIGSPYKRGVNEKRSLLDATYIRADMGEHRLLGFTFMSNRAGFVHHFGSQSDGVSYTRTHPKTGTVFQQKTSSQISQAFFDDVYVNSGALKMLEEGLAKTRTRDITLKLQSTILKIQKPNG